jgi:hypothetical protein
MSKHERISWVSLLVTLAIGWWYFSRVLGLPADANLHFPLARFVTQLVILAVLISIAGEIALRLVERVGGQSPDDSPADERDAQISLKATRNAHGVLGASVVVVLVQIALLERLRRPADPPSTVLEALGAGPLTPLLIAQLLLLALTLAALTAHASRIVYYRRGV